MKFELYASFGYELDNQIHSPKVRGGDAESEGARDEEQLQERVHSLKRTAHLCD